MRKKPVLVFLK